MSQSPTQQSRLGAQPVDHADDGAGGVERIADSIGPKVFTLRKRMGLSLRELGERSEVSAAAIHKIEQGGMVPAITTILKIAGALGRPVSYFVEEDAGRDDVAVLTSADQNRPVGTPHEGIELNSICGPYGRFLLEGARATVAPAASSGHKPIQHSGEEIVHVTRGMLEFTVTGQSYQVGPGSTLHFRADLPYSWRNPGSAEAHAIWVALRPR
jgi:transcriptional regulator with XRE-family HTH domain